MNTTSRALLQTVLTTDASVSPVERDVVQRLIAGAPPAPLAPVSTGEPLLVTQKEAAELLSVSRSTIWRMTNDALLHPVEILPGTWRYHYHEIATYARAGYGDTCCVWAEKTCKRPEMVTDEANVRPRLTTPNGSTKVDLIAAQ